MNVYFNPNPYGYRVGDCVIRALSKALDKSWEYIYLSLCIYGLCMGNLPSSNKVWAKFLKDNGFTAHTTDCDTLTDFCMQNPKGTFVVGTGSHAVAIVDGDIYDTWQSDDEQPIYYFRKEE